MAHPSVILYPRGRALSRRVPPAGRANKWLVPLSYAARGRDRILRTLDIYLGAEGTGPPHADAARSLGLSENAVAAAVYRLREEFQEILRAEVADTLAESEDVEEELRYLLRALG